MKINKKILMNHNRDLKNLEDEELMNNSFPGSLKSNNLLKDILFLDFVSDIEFLIYFLSSVLEFVIRVFLNFHCR